MVAARRNTRTGDGPSEPAFTMALNQMKSPPGIGVPLKLDVIELIPGSGCEKNARNFPNAGTRKLADCVLALDNLTLFWIPVRRATGRCCPKVLQCVTALGAL